MELYYTIIFSVVVATIAYLFWSINSDMKKLYNYILWQKATTDKQEFAIGELQRQMQRVIFAQKEKEE